MSQSFSSGKETTSDIAREKLIDIVKEQKAETQKHIKSILDMLERELNSGEWFVIEHSEVLVDDKDDFCMTVSISPVDRVIECGYVDKSPTILEVSESYGEAPVFTYGEGEEADIDNANFYRLMYWDKVYLPKP